jgi:hypothetical protein
MPMTNTMPAARRGPPVFVLAGLKLTRGLVGNICWFAADIDNDRVLVRGGLLQCRELAVEQGNGHEVLVSCGQAPVDQVVRSFFR